MRRGDVSPSRGKRKRRKRCINYSLIIIVKKKNEFIKEEIEAKEESEGEKEKES